VVLGVDFWWFLGRFFEYMPVYAVNRSLLTWARVLSIADVSHWFWSHSRTLQEQVRSEARTSPFRPNVRLRLRHKTRQRTRRQKLCQVCSSVI